MPAITASDLRQRLGHDCLSLALPAAEVAARLYHLGPLRVMTQASHAFLDQVGRFPRSDDVAQVGLVLGEDGLDLRLNLRAWHWLCLTRGQAAGDFELRVFDRHAAPLLRLASLPGSNLQAWAELYAQGSLEHPHFTPREALVKQDVQVAGLVDDWAAMGDVHDHFALLKRHGLTRYQGNQGVAPQFARRIGSAGTAALLGQLADSGLELMVFIYSPGSTQIYTGKLDSATRQGDSLVFDMPGDGDAAPTRFGIRDTVEAEAWRVYKPNAVGGVNSLEIFDAEQRLIVQLFGRRPAGQPEQPAWRELLDRLEAGQ